MLTPSQITSLQSANPPSGGAAVQNGQAMNDQQFQSWLGGSPSSQAPKQAQTYPVGNFLSSVPSAVGSLYGTAAQNTVDQQKTSFSNIGSDVSNAANDIQAGNDAFAKGNVGEGLKQGGKALVQGGLGTLSDAIQYFFAPLTGAVKTGRDTVAGVNPATGGMGLLASPTIQKSANNPNDPIMNAQDVLTKAAQAYPVLAKALTDAFTVATTAIGGVKAPEALDQLGTGVSKDLSTISDTASTVSNKVSDVAGTVKNKVSSMLPEAKPPVDTTAIKLKGVANDWQKPTTINKPAFNNARGVLAKSPETPQFLAEQKMNPFSHVEDGKYLTTDSAQALRDTAGKMSSDTLRPSLQMADYNTPKTPVEDLTTPALSNSKSSYGLTAGNSKAVQANINSELSALSEKYPKGMSLTDMHDEKITYADPNNSGYSPVKDPSVTNKAIANRAISSALGDTLESKAPQGVGVHDFNAYLSKYYKAADYLDSLNGKTAPVSVGQTIARGVARFGGAAIGGKLGGGVVTEFAGYQIGKALEHAVENLTNPMRESFLQNLKITNPEAFSSVEKYIGKQSADQATRLRLGAGTPLGTEKNPIIPAAPTTFEKPALESKTTSVNPKTGTQYVRDLNTGEKQIINPTKSSVPSSIPKDPQPLAKEAMKYKSAEEFVKAQPTLYHSGTADIKEVNLGKTNFNKTFYLSDNADYAKSFGGKNSTINEMALDPKANLIDLRKPTDAQIAEIKQGIDKLTAKNIPYGDNNFSFYPASEKTVLQGIANGEAYYAEMPGIKQVLKGLGYDGQITSEVPYAKNIGVWNKDVVKTKSQLTDIWNKVKGKK